jgi:short-subunit dehydrogenase
MSGRKLAIVTGASSGIGLEIAKLAARDGYDLIVAADEPLIDAAAGLKEHGIHVHSVEVDLSTDHGVGQLLSALGDRPVDVLVANAGQGHGGAFVDQAPESWKRTVGTNVIGTLSLVQSVLRRMLERGQGRILVTGSVAGYVPGSFNAVYNASKAFLDNFCAAISDEIRHSEVTVTVLKPGATDTDFFRRAEMLDTEVGRREKDDSAEVAKTGWKATLNGERSVVHGLANKAMVAAAGVVPEFVTAALHRAQAEPDQDRSTAKP